MIAPGRPRLRRDFGFYALTASLAVFFFVACGGGGNKTPSSLANGSNATASGGPSGGSTVAGYPQCPPAGSAGGLTGAGSTFIFPLMSKWVDDYEKACHVQINYQSVGSGAGINQVTQETVDFGATDGIMTDQQEAAANAAGGPIEHIALTSGATAVIYNLPGIQSGQLKLTPDVLAGIYLGSIKKWNDSTIAAANSGLKLPNSDIAVVHRSDGSGTTFIFTNYLSKVSPDWSSKVGYATSVNWPTGIGGAGSEGVAGQVRQIPGAIGYVELAYAEQNKLSLAQIQNKSGAFVEPTLAATTAAASGIPIPDDMKLLITDSSNTQAYPIAGFSWALVYTNQPDAGKGRALASFLWWAIHDGQKEAQPLSYAPLSQETVTKAEAQVLKLQCAGSPCLSK